MALRTPQIYTGGGVSIAAAPNRIAVPTALSSAALAFMSALVTGTGGAEAAVTGDNVILGWVENIFDNGGRRQNQNFADATQLAAAAHYVDYFPFAGLTLLMGEDGAGGNIADWTVTMYADVAVGTISEIDRNANPTGSALATVQIDSSSASATPTNLPIKIIAPDPSPTAALQASTVAKNYLVIQNLD